MKYLLDANVVFPAEPTSNLNISDLTQPASIMLRELSEARHEAFIHPSIHIDTKEDRDTDRKFSRAVLIQKYRVLSDPPAPPKAMTAILGIATPGSHDESDHQLLAALFCKRVDVLVTQDKGIHSKAQKLGISSRVLFVHQALRFLRTEARALRPTLPAVIAVHCDELDSSDPIFKSLEVEYHGFRVWFEEKCRATRRQAWIVKQEGRYAGICIIKDETPAESGIQGFPLKLCTFKIAESGFGKGFSELLLRNTLSYASERGHTHIYVTILPNHADLIAFFKKFGFVDVHRPTEVGELTLVKHLTFSQAEYEEYSPFEFHVRFGPKHLKFEGTEGFVVPIQPKYHKLLFPDAEPQLSLLGGESTFGNVIRKAYLCHSPIKKRIKAGSVLFFYRSDDKRAITCIGVAEKTWRGTDPIRIFSLVNLRTVYSYEEIVNIAHKEVLAIMFRYAKIVSPPISIEELQRAGVLSGPPQSIQTIHSKGMKWLQRRIQ